MIIKRLFLIFCSFTRHAAEESNLLLYHYILFIVVPSIARLIRILLVFEFFLVISETLSIFGGHAVALRYKSLGRGFDSRWCHWNFSLTESFRPHYCTKVDSGYNKNEYWNCFLAGKVSRCVGMRNLRTSYTLLLYLPLFCNM
jgi:hypothetical protein